jgi:apolipoprotein N-acyltransferase
MTTGALARINRTHLALSILSGLLLGLSFPPSTLGTLACVGLVPLLIVLADLHTYRACLKHVYVAMLIFHLITLNWTGGYAHANDPYMMIAGGVTMLAHPLFYFIPFSLYVFVKERLGGRPALVAFPFLWVGYEYTHSLSEWSFPWLTLGNSQSFDLARIQFISLTGIFGLSLWILVLNTLAFLLYSSLAQRGARRIGSGAAGWGALLLIVFFIPFVHGTIVVRNAAAEADTTRGITVGMVQSNVDPWEKWTLTGYQTIELYMRMTDSLVTLPGGRKPDLVLWPETAVPYYLLTDANWALLADVRSRLERIGVPLLTGLPHAVYYKNPKDAPRSAKRLATTGERYDSFNAAALIEPGTAPVQWYGKMKMVPFAERVPYADAFSFVDFLRWGVGIGGWQIGPDTTVFKERWTGAAFATVICYESVYPGFVASFVRKGAEFIAIITIDSWWDNMSGAYQHERFAVFRAVENRRWVARCAVGGISCFIDPYGRVYDETALFTQAVLRRTITRETALTYYSAHGDVVGDLCLLASGFFVAGAMGISFLHKKRALQWKSV